jgi:hypothetical protein
MPIVCTPTVKDGVLPPQVEVYVTGPELSGALTTLERVLPDGTATVVRGFQSYPTTGPIYVTDFEAPFYTDLRYRATAVSTITQVSYGPNQSVFPTGQVGTSTTDTAGYTVGNDITIAATGRITAVRYLRPANATGINKPVKLWSSPAGGVLATAVTDATTTTGWKTGIFATPVAVTAGQKVRATLDNAAGVLHNDVKSGTIVSGDLTMNPPNSYYNDPNQVGTFPTHLGSWNYYLDLVFQKTTGTTPAGTVTTSPLSAVVRMCFNVAWLSDPLNPGSGVRVYVEDGGWQEQDRHVDQDVFMPLGRRFPVVVSGMRKEPAYTIRLTTGSDTDTETIRTMLEQAQPALLRMAEARYGGWSGGYVALGAWKEQRWTNQFDKRTRVFEIPCWEVESPTAGAVISLWHWSDVLESYTTWDQVRTSKDSWATLLRNPTPGPR